MSYDDIRAEYELPESDEEPIHWLWLVLVAVVTWGGAWWLGQ